MYKRFRYFLTVIAATIVLIHNIVPHVHKNEISEEEHSIIHQNSTLNFIELLSLIFHEYTTDGEMEEMILRSQKNLEFIKIVLLNSDYIPINNIFKPLISEGFSCAYSAQNVLPPQSHKLSCWGIRPPPVA